MHLQHHKVTGELNLIFIFLFVSGKIHWNIYLTSLLEKSEGCPEFRQRLHEGGSHSHASQSGDTENDQTGMLITADEKIFEWQNFIAFWKLSLPGDILA